MGWSSKSPCRPCCAARLARQLSWGGQAACHFLARPGARPAPFPLPVLVSPTYLSSPVPTSTRPLLLPAGSLSLDFMFSSSCLDLHVRTGLRTGQTQPESPLPSGIRPLPTPAPTAPHWLTEGLLIQCTPAGTFCPTYLAYFGVVSDLLLILY